MRVSVLEMGSLKWRTKSRLLRFRRSSSDDHLLESQADQTPDRSRMFASLSSLDSSGLDDCSSPTSSSSYDPFTVEREVASHWINKWRQEDAHTPHYSNEQALFPEGPIFTGLWEAKALDSGREVKREYSQSSLERNLKSVLKDKISTFVFSNKSKSYSPQTSRSSLNNG